MIRIVVIMVKIMIIMVRTTVFMVVMDTVKVVQYMYIYSIAWWLFNLTLDALLWNYITLTQPCPTLTASALLLVVLLYFLVVSPHTPDSSLCQIASLMLAVMSDNTILYP